MTEHFFSALEVEEVEERHFNTNEWVAVIYDWEFWPALIEEETEQGLFTLKFLEPISTNKFKEHDKKDKLATPEILCKLPNPPLPISNRHWALPSDDYKLINEKMKAILEL